LTNWTTIRLEDCVDLLAGFAFKSQHFTSAPDDIALVKGENVSQGCILWEISKRWPASDWSKLEKYQLRPRDVVVAMDRPWIPAGLKWAYIRVRDPKALLVQRCSRLRSSSQLLDQNFLRFVIGGPGFENYVKPITTGVNVPHISGKQILDYEFTLPPLPVQRRIADILTAYDELIENNQRRIRILEEMARALYREWFVHFVFPGHENHPRVASPLGDIPTGWEVRKLGDVVHLITKGTTPTTLKRQFRTVGLNFIKAESIERSGALIEGKFAKIDNETHELLRRSKLCENDILFSIAGVIGRACIVPARFLPANTNQALAIVRCASSFLVQYLYLTLRDEEFQNYSFGRIVQTAQANVSLSDLRAAPVVIPSETLIARFNSFAVPVMGQIQILSEQIQNLRNTRDLLLPRLLSGQIELKPD
jgi:type I restriction enzyme, S subunit